MRKAQTEIRVTHHPKAADEWRFEVRRYGKVTAYSSKFYSRKRDAIRGAERLIAGMFQGVKITAK